MMNDAALLDSLIVASPDDLSIAHQNGTDGNATGGKAFFCFFNSGCEQGVHDMRLEQSRAGVTSFPLFGCD
jgi:hypothetical protein